MEHLHISSGAALEKRFGYSRAVRVGNHVWVAGTAPIMAGDADPPATAYEQAKVCLGIIERALKEAGASLVVMTGLGARDEARLNQARSFGVDVIIDAAHQDPVDELLRATGGRLADVVVDVTAKAPAAIADAVNLAAHGATVVIAGTRGVGGGPGIEPDLVVYKELHIIGALGVDYPAYQQAISLLTSERWPFDQISRHTAGFDDLPALLQTLASPDAGPPPALHNVFIPTA